MQQQLDTLRGDIPGCSLVAFGDRAARLILRTSAPRGWPQEKLDGLCRTAADQLARVEALAPTGAAMLRTVQATPEEVRVFVGLAGAGGETLCCVCPRGTDTEAVLARGSEALSGLPGCGP